MTDAGTEMPTSPIRATHAFKVIDGREVRADVIGARPLAGKPAVVWIHGGGLIFGSRTVSPREPFVRALLERDFVVVSLDHRLAPETKLPDIVDDVRDAWRWLNEVGPDRFGIDPERMAVGGGSAGAYLSLMGGYLLEPRPRAIASFWGYGDITAPWEAEPSSHYRQQYDLVTREEALASLAGPAVADPAGAVDRLLLLPVLPAAREVAG
jgi:acetyl esterase/lipase